MPWPGKIQKKCKKLVFLGTGRGQFPIHFWHLQTVPWWLWAQSLTQITKGGYPKNPSPQMPSSAGSLLALLRCTGSDPPLPPFTPLAAVRLPGPRPPSSRRGGGRGRGALQPAHRRPASPGPPLPPSPLCRGTALRYWAPPACRGQLRLRTDWDWVPSRVRNPEAPVRGSQKPKGDHSVKPPPYVNRGRGKKNPPIPDGASVTSRAPFPEKTMWKHAAIQRRSDQPCGLPKTTTSYS